MGSAPAGSLAWEMRGGFLFMEEMLCGRFMVRFAGLFGGDSSTFVATLLGHFSTSG